MGTRKVVLILIEGTDLSERVMEVLSSKNPIYILTDAFDSLQAVNVDSVTRSLKQK